MKRHPIGSKVAFVLALLLIGFGVLSAVLPLVPGGAVALPAGLALLAGHFPRLARYLDRAEVRLRKSLCRRLGERRWLGCSRLVKA